MQRGKRAFVSAVTLRLPPYPTPTKRFTSAALPPIWIARFQTRPRLRTDGCCP